MMGIVKAYDIRGIVPKEMDQYTANKVGKAVASLTQAKQVLLARDMRTTSPALEYALKYGVIAMGADAYLAGLCSTPEFYYALATGKYDAGIMVTASHNPKEYNGFKICRKNAVVINYETGLAELEKMLSATEWKSAGIGKLYDVSLRWRESYAQYVAAQVPLSDRHKLVFDAGNGMAGHTLPTLLSLISEIEARPLFFELDGTFPNHEANPVKEENLMLLKKSVVAEHAQLGLAFDGDADRVCFVDECGQMVSCDLAMCVLATHYLSSHKGAPIVFDVRSTRALGEAIEQAGGIPVVWKGGHSRIKQKMLEVDAPLGGEKSGHFFFKSFFSADCPDIAWLSIVRIMEETKKNLSELVDSFRKYYGGEEINYPLPQNHATVLKNIENHYPTAKTTYLDGLSLDMGEWWGNVRASNTEPLLRVNIEAKSQQLYEEKKEEIMRIIASS